MKYSKYNYLFFYNKANIYLLYNSVSNAFIQLDQENYQKLKDLEKFPEKINDLEDIDYLVKNKILIEDDKLIYYQKKHQLYQSRYNKKYIAYTIAPTDDCNFCCPYCYEKENQKNYITKEILDQLLENIKQNKEIGHIGIGWYGGEPLLAFDKVYYFSQELKKIGIPFGASMVTNGYLLTEENVGKFKESNITNIQVTIDGEEDIHDKRRMLKSGKGTFKTILNNIKRSVQIYPELRISIRVNIDESNKDNFVRIEEYLNREINCKNVSVYHAFINWDISQHCKKTCGLDTGENQASFLIKEAKANGKYFRDFFPSYNLNQCMMRSDNTMLIGPTGHMYKCWHHLGDIEKAVGMMDGKERNENNLYKYLNAADFLDDKECQDCFFFPTCFGGCPDLRIQKEFEGKDSDFCIIAKYKLQEFLELHYDHITSLK